MVKIRFFTLLFVSFSIYFVSCSESRSDEFELISTRSPFDFHCIEAFQGKLYATGGDIWNRSNMATSSNGSEWSVDSFANKSIFDLYSYDHSLFGVGNDGYIFSGRSDLQLTRTKFWGLLRSFTASQEGFIAVGGKDFNKGWIYKVSSELQIDTAHYFENEISSVSCNDSGRCIACGYGTILTSDNFGVSWQRSSENGDYYNSITVNDQDEFFIVGYNGTIIKSADNGETWSKIKNGHSPLANNKPFRTIKFHGEQGVIVGDNGLIWISQNGGNEWNDASIHTDLDLFDFAFFQSNIICASEAGQIIKITLGN